VLGAKALLPDKEDGGKKKSGMNVARGLLTMILEFFYPDGRPEDPAPKNAYIELTGVHFMMSTPWSSTSRRSRAAVSTSS